ncbi:MAG: ABC transporter ATP-binding protein [Sulfuricaulis sp.]|uniref:ABC transporter ATP-binding protein n=1 Tax=Sulfuricaulis sp. TaxID=2003553 RepID=UPI0025E95CB2|nr:ABC transporter ATP-binding protein [Sulfuricaulis sp.]MCR4346823.1 ABC transporter ATP-binding protein [Sulfuricaulis sp.]
MLRAQNLTLRIAGRTLCANLNVSLEAGENWVMLGANGSGKTTLLHTLAGLRAPETGTVSLDNGEINKIPARTRAQRLGVLFQDMESGFPATVIETVLTGRYPHLDRWQWEGAEDYRAAEAALDAVGLNGLDRRPLATLSGGERRRVEIATLLAQDAPICLLDEPINHLDLRHQVQMLDLLADRAHRPGHLNLFVLHDVNLALRFGTHGMLLFDNGECLHGPLSELLNRPNLERLYHCRLREIRDDVTSWFLPA